MRIAGLSIQPVARERFGPSVDPAWSFTPTGVRKANPDWLFSRYSLLRSGDVLATPLPFGPSSRFRSNTPFAAFCDTIARNCFLPSHDSVTCRRSPEVSSTTFNAQPPDYNQCPLMDTDFAVMCPLVRHRMPQIQFLYIGSRLCSALLSGPASRRVLFHPCASLTLHLHLVR